ncbi:MAG: T9SS type A sorting domain-containing protein, partial [Flavobacteriales bacterium]|nr:T9SS type A sorting domain-containing protein [Flavobacteriales bacterium]
ETMTRFTLFCMLLAGTTLQAQSYRPFPESDAAWNETHGMITVAPGGAFAWVDCERVVHFANDTLINGTSYHQLWSHGHCHGYEIPNMTNPWDYDEPDALVRLFRQDTAARQVFAFDTLMAQERLWFDFGIGLGPYPATIDNQLVGDLHVVALDSMELNDGWHRTWVLGMMQNGVLVDSAFCTVIEAVGSTYGVIAPFGLVMPFEWNDMLNCQVVDSATIYPYGGGPCDLTVEVPEQERTTAVVAYPNPTTGIVRLSGGIGNRHFEIWNARGVLVRSGSLDGDRIDLGDLPPSVYTIRSIGPGDGAAQVFRVVRE